MSGRNVFGTAPRESGARVEKRWGRRGSSKRPADTESAAMTQPDPFDVSASGNLSHLVNDELPAKLASVLFNPLPLPLPPPLPQFSLLTKIVEELEGKKSYCVVFIDSA